MTKEKEAIAKAPAGRPKRTSIGVRNILTLSGKKPGYEYRFVNDSSDRIEQFKANGWELVPADEVVIGDKRLGSPSNGTSVAKASVGMGDQAYAMRIRSDWFAEDQAEKQALVNATEEATRQEALNGTYGKLDISRS